MVGKRDRDLEAVDVDVDEEIHCSQPIVKCQPSPAKGKNAKEKAADAAKKDLLKKKVADGSFKIDPEIPMSPDGRIYHLDCKAADLADNIILVGDPGRVPKVSAYFDEITYKNSHREITIHTGFYKKVRMSVLSTGMGTDNVEIVMNEIHALKEYDVENCKWRTRATDAKEKGEKVEPVPKVNIIRVGTSGCPQGDVTCGVLAVSRFAIGMDNTCQYYQQEMPASVQALKKIANDVETGLGKVGVYAAPAHPDVTAALIASVDKIAKARGSISGITASGSGFYGCQGRMVGRFKGHLTLPDLIDRLGKIRLPAKDAGTKTEQRVVNIEMENSAICFLSHILGYRAATVCVVLATRAGDKATFLSPEECAKAVTDAITVALDAMITLDGDDFKPTTDVVVAAAKKGKK